MQNKSLNGNSGKYYDKTRYTRTAPKTEDLTVSREPGNSGKASLKKCYLSEIPHDEQKFTLMLVKEERFDHFRQRNNSPEDIADGIEVNAEGLGYQEERMAWRAEAS